jgi:hypothetical protein
LSQVNTNAYVATVTLSDSNSRAVTYVQQLLPNGGISLSVKNATASLHWQSIGGHVFQTVTDPNAGTFHDEYYVKDGVIVGAPNYDWSYLFPEAQIATYFANVTAQMHTEDVPGSNQNVPVGQDYNRILGDLEIGGTLTIGMGVAFGPFGAAAGGVASYAIIDVYQNDPKVKNYSGFGLLYCAWVASTIEFDGFLLGSTAYQKEQVLNKLGCH